jgi:S-adenosylmethionine synthetase
MDYYGPRVPTGGSALFGKDAFKPDRVNAVRARELALSEVRAQNAREATVTLVYFPGMLQGEITRIVVKP